MRVPPDQSTTAADARSSARSGSRHAELARDARQPRAEHERLDAAVRRDRRVQVLEQHPRVRRHRARHVAARARACAGPATCARQRRSSGSPPWRSDARTVACRSGRTPRRRVARVRRASRIGMCRARRDDDPPRLAPARGRCTRRSPSRAAARSGCTRRAGSRPRRPCSAARPPAAAPRRAGRRAPRPAACPRGRGSDAAGVAEHGREGAVEDRVVGALRAQHGPQREVDVAALRRVDRRERPRAGLELAGPDPHAARAHQRRERREALQHGAARPPRLGGQRGAAVRHPRAPPAPARARGPRGPSAPRRGCRRDRRSGRRAR